MKKVSTIAAHGSTMFAALHSQVSVRDLIQGIIVNSANNASWRLPKRSPAAKPLLARS